MERTSSFASTYATDQDLDASKTSRLLAAIDTWLQRGRTHDLDIQTTTSYDTSASIPTLSTVIMPSLADTGGEATLFAGNTSAEYTYYQCYDEFECAHNNRRMPDGCTIYRALARQIIGDPRSYNYIRQQVQRFVIRVGLPDHPLHAEYCARETRFDLTSEVPLFAALEAPDYAPSVEVLWTIARALKVRVKVFHHCSLAGKLQDAVIDVGDCGLPAYRILKLSTNTGMAVRFASLLPDETGKALVEYLVSHKKASRPGTMQVKQISWAMATEDSQWGEQTFMKCYNQYRAGSRMSDLGLSDPLQRMDVFSVVVNDLLHIAGALDLIREALLRAPNQGRPVRCLDGSVRSLRAFVASDAEFVKLPREVAAKSYNPRDHVGYGLLEELCSILTVAVGRHLVVQFNVVHVLENANKHTVPALERLFRELIYCPEIVKLWWNPQMDFRVLDNTIAHMYQGTARPETWGVVRDEYEDEHGRDRWESRSTTFPPVFHIHSPHFDGERPDDLKEYVRITDCGLHREEENTPWMYGGCPCAYGNIDIAALFNSFCRQHGLPMRKSDWVCVRDGFRYDDLLHTMLGSDRLADILSQMKSAGGNEAFYQRLGKPGMELDDAAMGYNVGDVAGINLIFEQLLANQDRCFVGSILHAYSKYSSRNEDYSRLYKKSWQSGGCHSSMSGHAMAFLYSMTTRRTSRICHSAGIWRSQTSSLSS